MFTKQRYDQMLDRYPQRVNQGALWSYRGGYEEMKWIHGVFRRSGAREILHEARISPVEKSLWTLWLCRASNIDVHSK